MSARLRWPCIFFAFALSGCAPLPFLGGGIAGAGMDTSWALEDVKNYRGFTSPDIAVVHEEQRSTTQHNRNDLLNRFEERAFVNHTDSTDFGGLTITFKHQRITIEKRSKVIVTERIPSVFYFSGLQVAVAHVNGEQWLIALTYSRASTGMVWLGVYRADGSPLYLGTVSRGDIWDVIPAQDGIMLLGHSRSTTIRVKRQSEPNA
jgi:hypothetical protein